jgi:hypothetical protein
MIGIAQHQRSIDALEMFRRERLHRSLRANGCKNGSNEVAVRRGKNARTGAIILVCNFEIKHEVDYTFMSLGGCKQTLEIFTLWIFNGMIESVTCPFDFGQRPPRLSRGLVN